MRVLVPLWRRQRAIGQRLRQRIAGVMARSVAAGYRADDPTSTLSALLPAGRKQRKHHRFLPAEDLREALAKVEGSRAWVGTQLVRVDRVQRQAGVQESLLEVPVPGARRLIGDHVRRHGTTGERPLERRRTLGPTRVRCRPPVATLPPDDTGAPEPWPGHPCRASEPQKCAVFGAWARPVRISLIRYGVRPVRACQPDTLLARQSVGRFQRWQPRICG